MSAAKSGTGLANAAPPHPGFAALSPGYALSTERTSYPGIHVKVVRQ
ncbi:MAG TPA: hypothetical protein VKC66_38255 [Xanthobacteraceae bacterium]|nr:hypothetical protein [Xanthobacteraceae bacterium]